MNAPLVYLVLAALAFNGCDGETIDPPDADGDGDADIDGDGDVVSDGDSGRDESWLVHLGSGICRRYGNGLIETPDGGVMLAGFYDDESSEAGIWVVGLDADHQMRWEMLLGEGDEWANDAAPHPDGGMVVSGHSGDRGWLAHIAVDGTPLWQRVFAAEGPRDIPAISSTAGGGMMLAGVMGGASEAASDLWAARADGSGEPEWELHFVDVKVRYAAGSTTADGGALVAGQGPSEGVQWTHLARLDAAGEVLWQRRIDRASTGASRRFSVVETSDGDVAVVMTGGTGIAVIRLSAEGDLEWARAVGGAAEVRGGAAVADSEGGLAIGGTESAFSSTPYNHWNFGLDATGEITWEWSVTAEEVGEVRDMVATSDGGVLAMSGGCADTWLLKVGPGGAFDGECDALVETSAVVAEIEVSVEEVEAEVSDVTSESSLSTPEVFESTSEATLLCAGGRSASSD